MTGTQNHAAICGVTAAIDYLVDIGRNRLANPAASRRAALIAAMQAIEEYERSLIARLIDGLVSLPHVKVYGITDPARMHERVPTLALTITGIPSIEAARRLGEQGIYCWHGHYYAIAICEALGQTAGGMIRLGLMHTNTSQEVDRTLQAIHGVL